MPGSVCVFVHIGGRFLCLAVCVCACLSESFVACDHFEVVSVLGDLVLSEFRFLALA